MAKRRHIFKHAAHDEMKRLIKDAGKFTAGLGEACTKNVNRVTY